jgi:hypothetical protein
VALLCTRPAHKFTLHRFYAGALRRLTIPRLRAHRVNRREKCCGSSGTTAAARPRSRQKRTGSRVRSHSRQAWRPNGRTAAFQIPGAARGTAGVQAAGPWHISPCPPFDALQSAFNGSHDLTSDWHLSNSSLDSPHLPCILIDEHIKACHVV